MISTLSAPIMEVKREDPPKKSPGHGYLVDFSRELNGFQCRHIHTYIHPHMHVHVYTATYLHTYMHTCIHTLIKKNLQGTNIFPWKPSILSRWFSCFSPGVLGSCGWLQDTGFPPPWQNSPETNRWIWKQNKGNKTHGKLLSNFKSYHLEISELHGNYCKS